MTDRSAPTSTALGTVAAPLAGLLGRSRCVRVGGVHGGAVGLIVAAASARAKATLVVVPDARQADGVLLDVAAFLGRTPFGFPVWPHEDWGRATRLWALAGGAVAIVTARALWRDARHGPPGRRRLRR